MRRVNIEMYNENSSVSDTNAIENVVQLMEDMGLFSAFVSSDENYNFFFYYNTTPIVDFNITISNIFDAKTGTMNILLLVEIKSWSRDVVSQKEWLPPTSNTASAKLSLIDLFAKYYTSNFDLRSKYEDLNSRPHKRIVT